MKEKRKERTGIRDILAVDAAKAVNTGLHLMGRQGTSLPGKAALEISPTVLSMLSSKVREKIFAVCGTNGKTTTNNLLCFLLEKQGKRVVCNRMGANMINGIATAFAEHADAFGGLYADYACLEIDEAAAAHIFPLVKPDYLILTNLFRDQLDRYGEIDIIMEKLGNAIAAVPRMKLIVNADDPLSVYLAKKSGHSYVTYGISEKTCGSEKEGAGEIRDGRFCKACGSLLTYSWHHYSQMGLWHCPQCGFSRPEPDYEASGIVMDQGLRFELSGHPVSTDMAGFYQVYNILAVWSALSEAGQRENAAGTVERFIGGYKPRFGREEQFNIHGRRVMLNLAKNPAGFNQNIETVLKDREPKELIIVINDREQDGTDVSWLWDVDFDRFRDESIKSITASGIRALDLALRFKYVDIPVKIEEDIKKTLDSELTEGNCHLYVLANYTALFDIHRILDRKSIK